MDSCGERMEFVTAVITVGSSSELLSEGDDSMFSPGEFSSGEDSGREEEGRSAKRYPSTETRFAFSSGGSDCGTS